MANLPMERAPSALPRRLWRMAPYGLAVFSLLLASAIYVKYRINQEPPRHEPAAWHPGAPSPIARALAPGAVIGKQLFVFGGFYTRDLRVTRRVDAYDPIRDRWTRRANMPITNTHIAVATDGDTAWFAGGFVGHHPGKATAKVFNYHAPTDRWTPATPLPGPRAAGTLVRLGRNLHFIGGFLPDRDTTPGDHWVLPLDGEQKWTSLARLPKARGHHGAVALNGKIYVVGGSFNHDTDRQDVAFVHRYDPATDRWTEVAPLPYGLSHIESSTLAWNGRIYVFGGRSDTGSSRLKRFLQPQPVGRRSAVPDVNAYDPATDTWSPQPELPVGLMIPVVAEVNGRLVVTNGSTMNTFFPQGSTYVSCLPLVVKKLRVKILC